MRPNASRLVALVAALSMSCVPSASWSAENCQIRAGSATGITRGFAEYESFLIIRQVTGNWPIQNDHISAPRYTCKQKNVLWHCRATAKICKG